MRREEWEALSADERRSYANAERACLTAGCEEPAGTPWGRHWCADCDDERIRRISAQLADLRRGVTRPPH